MKNRKIIVVAFMLVAVLMLGVGYAALTVDLNLSGNATFDPAKSQNEFSENIYLADSATTILRGDGTTDLKDTYVKKTQHSVDLAVNSLALAGDSVTYEFEIYSTSVHSAEVAVKSLKIQAAEQTETVADSGIYEGDDWLTTKVEFVDGTTLPAGADGAPSSITVKLTFTLLKNPTATTVRSINITFDATTTD